MAITAKQKLFEIKHKNAQAVKNDLCVQVMNHQL